MIEATYKEMPAELPVPLPDRIRLEGNTAGYYQLVRDRDETGACRYQWVQEVGVRLAYWGDPCPQCQAPVDLLSTQNEWCFYCKKCDMRFNANREAKPA